MRERRSQRQAIVVVWLSLLVDTYWMWEVCVREGLDLSGSNRRSLAELARRCVLGMGSVCGIG